MGLAKLFETIIKGGEEETSDSSGPFAQVPPFPDRSLPFTRPLAGV